MKSQINILRQIQEFVLTRDEHQRLGDGSRMDPLTASIEALKSTLNPQAAALYERLYQRSHFVVAAMANGNCTGCGMQVPTSAARQVRLGEHLVTCSNCGRLLYAIGANEARNVAEPPGEEEVRNGISRFSAEELMLPNLKADNSAAAIGQLAELMQRHRFIDNAAALVKAALDRETLVTTAMPGALAFPHVRGVEGGGLTFALGVSPKGIDWDGEKVHIVFLTAIPVAVSAFYLKLMAAFSKAFGEEDNVKRLVAAKTASQLWKVLLKVTGGLVK